jgi:hypothetical protein
VRLVLPAVRAELFQLDPLGRGFLVLRARIIPVLALGALKRDYFSRHLKPFCSSPVARRPSIQRGQPQGIDARRATSDKRFNLQSP